METKEDKKHKILVVDDEPGIRELLLDILNFLGYQSLMAANGVEALETLARDKVDLIISDIRMPRMNGIELLKTVKNQGVKIPFVLISGYKLNDDDKVVAEKMASGFLAKPFEIEQIKTIVANLLPA